VIYSINSFNGSAPHIEERNHESLLPPAEWDRYRNAQGEWKEWLHMFCYENDDVTAVGTRHVFQQPMPWVFPEAPDIEMLRARAALGMLSKTPGWGKFMGLPRFPIPSACNVFAIVLPNYTDQALAQFLADKKRTLLKGSHYHKSYSQWLYDNYLFMTPFNKPRSLNENTRSDQSRTNAVQSRRSSLNSGTSGVR
jgi:hypothetical protein